MSFPWSISSSFWPAELTTVTPFIIFTFLMNFSPKKLRISMTVLFSDVTQLMGKWAYTARILYSKPCKRQTQLIDLSFYNFNSKSHLGYSSDHVGDVRADSSDSSDLLLLTKPFVNLEFIFSDHLRMAKLQYPAYHSDQTALFTCISSAKCLKSRVNLPRGPTTVTRLAFTLTVTPS